MLSYTMSGQGKMLQFVYSSEVERSLKHYVWSNRRELQEIGNGEFPERYYSDDDGEGLEKQGVKIHKLPQIAEFFIV